MLDEFVGLRVHRVLAFPATRLNVLDEGRKLVLVRSYSALVETRAMFGWGGWPSASAFGNDRR